MKSILLKSGDIVKIERAFYKEKVYETTIRGVELNISNKYKIEISEKRWVKEPWSMVRLCHDFETGFVDDFYEIKDIEKELQYRKSDVEMFGETRGAVVVTPHCWNGYFEGCLSEDNGFKFKPALSMPEIASRYIITCVGDKVFNIERTTI